MNQPHRTSLLLDDVARLRADAATLVHTSRSFSGHLSDLARAALERGPYATLAASVGVGLVLGGGVPVAAIRRALGLGLQMAVTRAVSNGLANAADVARSSSPSEPGDRP